MSLKNLYKDYQLVRVPLNFILGFIVFTLVGSIIPSILRPLAIIYLNNFDPNEYYTVHEYRVGTCDRTNCSETFEEKTEFDRCEQMAISLIRTNSTPLEVSFVINLRGYSEGSITKKSDDNSLDFLSIIPYVENETVFSPRPDDYLCVPTGQYVETIYINYDAPLFTQEEVNRFQILESEIITISETAETVSE